MAVLLIIVGILLLVKGADMLVDGAAGIASRHGLPPLVVGLTVVSFGTSAPELATSITAAWMGSGDISFGNVAGSNVINILLILGISALVRPLPVHFNLLKRDIPVMIVASAVLCRLGSAGTVDRLHAAGLLLLFALYLAWCLKQPDISFAEAVSPAAAGEFRQWAFALSGIVLLGIGAALFVRGARTTAASLGMSEAVIGLTIVGVGTSLPELVTSVVAAARNQADISIGNVVGSNIFNALFILGMAGFISPFRLAHDPFLMYVALPAVMISALVLLPFSLTGRRVSRFEGAILACAAAAYFILAFVR